MQPYEQLGSFYLGNEVDPNNDTPELILYDAKDLTTHAVIIGMTGSGKTGLGICLLEDALLDGIPVIAVDPKGDMGNLLLSFPDLSAEQFEPYIDPSEAAQEGITIAELARQKSILWQKGLAQTHQSPERIQNMRDAIDMNLFTPGATYGRPISLLQSLTAPNAELKADKDVYRERIASATTGMLSLLGIENNPLSREHVLLTTILEHYWDQGQDIALADLIAVIQTPPFEQIGVMDIETMYPAKERLKLAMMLNNLLASPGFAAWTQGEPLDTQRFLFNDKGKPQLSVMNIAHLSEEERMFFVTMLLNDILAWMRTQPGTGSLRALLYIDELFGYMPPLGNPATKPLLLTLLKQARAYGLGLVLSTQNPVDLDYKGLSNTGTWFIGKLQTEQDRNRVMDGLLSATEEGFDKKELDEAFNHLGKRKFLMHNIHESSPVIMTTRWAMSYLAGPLSRQHIETLCQQQEELKAQTTNSLSSPHDSNGNNDNNDKHNKQLGVKYPNLGADIEQFFVPPTQVVTNTSALLYQPSLLAVIDIHYEDNKSDIRTTTKHAFSTFFSDGAIAIDWRNAHELFVHHPDNLSRIGDDKPKGAHFMQPLDIANQKNYYKDWEKALTLWVRQNKPLEVLKHSELNCCSQPHETESQFRQRIAIQLREARDSEVEQLRTKLEKKLKTLKAKQERAEIKLQKETEQASGKTMDAIIGAGTAIFSAFFSRKKVSVTNARRLGSAIKKASGAFNERDDIDVAKNAIENIQAEIDALNQSFTKEQDAITKRFEAVDAPLETIHIYPKATGVQVIAFGIGWLPGVEDNGTWVAV